MSSIYSGSRASSRLVSDNTVVKFWDEHIKGMLFGVLYAMVKDNNVNRGFVITSFVFEFLEMAILCFRDAFHWGGITYSFDFNSSMMSYYAFRIVFWTMVSIICCTILLCAYIGYTFYKGEIKSTYVLKVIRWVVTLLTSVLFIPILYFIFSTLACDYSTKTPSLLLYPGNPCWKDHTIPAIVAIVLVVVFFIICLFAGLTFFEHDPTNVKSCGRLQNRFETAAMGVKLVFVVITVFLNDTPAAFAVVSFLCAVLLFVGSVLTLPFYDHKLNLMRSGEYAGLVWINIGMVASMALNDDKNLAPTIVALVGVPFAMAAGAFAADRRFKFLCDPALVEGVVSTELETLPAAQQKKKKSVNFEGPSKNKLLKNQLFARLWFPWDVEIAARFAHGNPNAALIEKGKLVYQTGISKFSKSAIVMQAYANFMFTTVGDWQLGYVILEKLRKMYSVLDIQFFIYRYDKDRERRIEGGNDRIGDFIDFMEYKKLQQAARRHHSTSLVCVRKFWRYLLEPKVDVMQLSLLSSKIALAQRKAEEHYTKLIKNYPKNVSLLRDYAKYLEEVALDERQAQEIRRKADKYEQLEMESATASHRSSNNIPMVTPGDAETNSEHDTSELRSENSETVDDYSASSKSSGVRAKLVEARLDKNNSLKKLGWIMLATTIFSLVVGVAELIVLDKMIGTYSYALESQNSAGGAAHVATKISRSAADSYLIGEQTVSLGANVSYSYLTGNTFYGIASDNIQSIYMFQNILKSLYWGDSDTTSFASRRFLRVKAKEGFVAKVDITSHSMNYSEFDHNLPNRAKVEKFFTEKRYNETLYVSNTTGISVNRNYNTIGLWSMCSLYGLTAFDIAKIPLTTYFNFTQLATYGISISYTLENAQEIAQGMLDIVDFYGERIASSLSLIMLTCMIIFLVAAALLLIASIAMFRPIVQKIFTAKVRTFSMFTVIPSSVVKVMCRRRVTHATNNYSSDEDETDNEKPKFFGEENHEQVDGATADEEPEETKEVEAPQEPHELVSFNSFKDDKGIPFKSEESTHALTINVRSITEGEPKEEEEREVPDTPIRALKRRISTLSNVFRIKPAYAKVEHEEEEEKNVEDEKANEKGKKKHTHSKHSRLDTSSLSAVTRRLHLSYLIAIGCIIIAFMVSFLMINNFLKSLVSISKDMVLSDLRTQYIQQYSMDISILLAYPYGHPVAAQYYDYSRTDLKNMFESYNNASAKSYQMEILFSQNCFIINATACPAKSSPYYDLVMNGYDYAFFQLYMRGKDLLDTYDVTHSLTIDNANYGTFRQLSDWMIDGAETLTYLVYKDAKNKISNTKNYIAIITAVECIVFLLIHVIIFRPFVKQLKSESDHTFALIRMIPRKLLQNVPEIQQFIQDTLAGDDSDSE